MNIRRYAICIAALTALTTLAGTSAAAARTLTMGTQCTHPPYNYREANGEIVGFDVDIARELGRRIGAEIEIRCLRFESLIPALLNKQFDVIFSSLSITEERKKALDFSLPYRSATTQFVGKKGLNIEPFINNEPNPAALKGRVIGVQRSSTHDLYLQAKFPGTEVKRYDAFETVMLDLQAGRIDLAMGSPIKISTDFLEKPAGANFSFYGHELEDAKLLGEGVGAAVRKGDTELLQELNKAMQSIYDDGTFKQINLKYWTFSVMPAVWK